IGAEVERLAQLLADDLQGGPDHRIIAGRPGALLAGLDRREVDPLGCPVLTHDGRRCNHDHTPSRLVLLCRRPRRAVLGKAGGTAAAGPGAATAPRPPAR